MAAITGSWRAQFSGQQIQAQQWGTGVNPIHGMPTGDGRNIAPYGSSNLISPAVVDEPNDYGYAEEDVSSAFWGYGTETGLSERPRWGENDTPKGTDGYLREDYPAYGEYVGGRPGGSGIRSIIRGAFATFRAKQTPNEDVAQGWENKVRTYVEDSGTSDPSQYEMQTSMVQRDKVRAGSQVAAGRENEYDAPIQQRIPGMRLKVYTASDSPRHAEMEPKAQEMMVRPFYLRTAGTGYREWMKPNEMYVSEPLTRQSPDNPYTGPTAGGPSDYGFTDEDVTY